MKITPRPSSTRGHADHGWLNSYHTFSFASYHDPRFTHFGSLRVLNEDRVHPGTGFPTHPHRNFEIFSYILSGELTHRDSMLAAKGGASQAGKDDFYRMKRGDVQFTTGGTGIAHSEFNEHGKETVHFLQIWVVPWKNGLKPRYHTRSFEEEKKREGFVTVLSPLKAGVNASVKAEEEAKPAVDGTIPIHADFVMGAGVLEPGRTFRWRFGGREEGVVKSVARKVYVHLPMTTKGKSAMVRLGGEDGSVLSEGDGAFVDGVKAGEELVVESIGKEDAEVIILDSDSD